MGRSFTSYIGAFVWGGHLLHIHRSVRMGRSFTSYIGAFVWGGHLLYT